MIAARTARCAWVAWVAALAAACRGGGGAPDPRAGQPPRIDVTCVIVEDGALCSFTNRGGAGSRCVKAIYAGAEAKLHVSPEVCSGRLVGDGVSSSLAKFDARPADSCGDELRDCTVRVAEPHAAEAVAASWRAELGAPPTGPLTEAECEKLWAHAMDVEYRERTEGKDEEEVRRADEWRQYMEEDYHDPFLHECQSDFTRTQLECAMKANTRDAIEACE